MELLSFLLLIVILIITLKQNSKLSQQLLQMETDLRSLHRQLLKLTIVKPAEKETIAPEPIYPTETPKPFKSIFTIADEQASAIKEATEEVEAVKVSAEKITVPELEIPALVEEKKATIIPQQTIPTPPPSPGFFERHPDMEKFIGENLISKIGIAILVLAIGYFVKYAIDQNWIGPVARVSIGILCGGILTALAHKFRNSYRAFSSVLVGGGIAIFYFTITLAFQQFHLFSQTMAFAIMIVITIFAVALSFLYDKQELAIIALIGGFAAPMLVSTGEGNYKVLFSYLIILNSGLLVIAYRKSWRILNLLSFVFTVLMFGFWLIALKYNEPALTFKTGFLFATIFYLLFFIINIAHNIREKKQFIASDFGILLANTSLYFGAGIYCINNMDAGAYRGLFSALMGVFNLSVTYFLYRKQTVDANILYLLIGITLTFISITAPIQLEGNYITIFWASEAVLLYWLFTKSKIRIIQFSAGLVWILMLISLLMDWMNLYGFSFDRKLAIIFNKGFITTLFAAGATYLLFIIRGAEDESIKAITAKIIPGKNSFRIIALILLFAAGAFEINYQFDAHYPGLNIEMLYLLLYTVAFLNILTAVAQKFELLQLPDTTYIIMYAACIFLYLLGINETFSIQAQALISQQNSIHFIAHWAFVGLIAMVLYRLIRLLVNLKTEANSNNQFKVWILCSFIVIYLSVEIHLTVNQLFYGANNSLQNIQRIYIKTGLPILWGICSFVFMWLGMHFKYRSLRIISLTLFTITLLKLFIFDIKNIPAAGKIAAFFSLGVLLLVVSFMYQRLKKIIIDNEEKNG